MSRILRELCGFVVVLAVILALFVAASSATGCVAHPNAERAAAYAEQQRAVNLRAAVAAIHTEARAWAEANARWWAAVPPMLREPGSAPAASGTQAGGAR